MLGEFNSNNPVVFLFKLTTRVFVIYSIEDYSLLFVATLAPYLMHLYEENLHIVLLIDAKNIKLTEFAFNSTTKIILSPRGQFEHPGRFPIDLTCVYSISTRLVKAF